MVSAGSGRDRLHGRTPGTVFPCGPHTPQGHAGHGRGRCTPGKTGANLIRLAAARRGTDSQGRDTTSQHSHYVHGYSDTEAQRLTDQAQTLSDLLHHDTRYPAGSLVLEAGCGTGAQTVLIAPESPGACFICIDRSATSLAVAAGKADEAGIGNAGFLEADLFHLPFSPGTFDHVFLCFVLEHVKDPGKALMCAQRALRHGGTLTVIEGDHGSASFYPESPYARRAIRCLVDLQAGLGGNALIGRELYPLLTRAGFRDVVVSPRMVYVDNSRPWLEEGFTRQTFTAMVEGVGEEAVRKGLVTRAEWDQGIADLYRTAEPGGVFCYTFYKAVGTRGDFPDPAR